MKCSDCNHFVTDIYAGCAYCKAIKTLKGMTKDQIAMSAADLFGYGLTDFDGMTKAEVIDYLSGHMAEQIAAYHVAA